MPVLGPQGVPLGLALPLTRLRLGVPGGDAIIAATQPQAQTIPPLRAPNISYCCFHN